jgi:hypothetical protein
MKPLFLQLLDRQYPMNSFSHTRKIVRGMVMNDQGLFALIKFNSLINLVSVII